MVLSSAKGEMMETKVMTFKEWCELNGRLHTGARDFEEFERNAKDYEAYLATVRKGK